MSPPTIRGLETEVEELSFRWVLEELSIRGKTLLPILELYSDLCLRLAYDALMLMPKFASTLKTLIGNKEKLSELARTPLNENCSTVILNKLPKKLGDPGRFLIPCEFTRLLQISLLFGDSDFLLFEEADSFLALEDDPTSSEVDPTYQDPEGDILLLEAILNSEPPPPSQIKELISAGVRERTQNSVEDKSLNLR
ncbi:hypothetical protein Tco_1066640 [Tanacetum coccineum]|uniref:Reverse transcriptase domain-containing protein n=1 Tax=Tanacetum coccineum TaxID=301880 RepID=A0ABQ5HCQ8_9ASTR